MLITCTIISVRQGCPTSVFLFIIYADALIKMIKTRSPLDGFLVSHINTVIFVTSKRELTSKLKILCEYCDEYGMQVNESKTQFKVIR